MILFHAKRDGTVTTTPNFVPQGSSMQDLVVVSEFDYAYCAIKLLPASGEYIEDVQCDLILKEDGNFLWTAPLHPKATVVAGSVDYQLIFTAADGTTQTTLVGSFNVPRGVPVATPPTVGELSSKTIADLYNILGNISALFSGHEGDITKNKTDIAQNKTDIAALKKTIASAGYVTIPATEWTDNAPTVATVPISGVDRGSIILMLPANETTKLAANNAKLSAYPVAFAPGGGESNVSIFRAEAEKAPDADMTFAYVVIKTEYDSRSPLAAIIGVDAYGEGGTASGVDEAAVKKIINSLLGNVDNVRQYSADNPPPYPVTLVNGKKGEVNLNATDVGARPSTWMPTAADVGADPANTAQTLVNDLARKTAQDLANYYTKSQTLTKDEINALVSAIPKFDIEVVASLPIYNISENTVYLVKSGADSTNLYTEYIRANGAWERLGTQTVDLTGYATEAWVNELIAAYVKTADMEAYVAGLLKSYITKDVADETYQPAGDYPTTADMGTAISNATKDLAPKSLIPTKVSQLANDSGYLHKNQGVANAGKLMMVAADGSVTYIEIADLGLSGGDVVGNVDTDKNIVLTGDLAPGTYTFAYLVRKSDGTTETVTIGTYTVEEETETKTYTIEWCNYDGTVLEIDEEVPEGETPVYNGATPTKPDDDQYTYTFDRWSPTVVAATEDAAYTATYTQTAKPTEPTQPRNFANPAGSDWVNGTRLTTDINQTKPLTGGASTNYIAIQSGDTVTCSGINFEDSNNRIAIDGTYLSIGTASQVSTTWVSSNLVSDVTYDSTRITLTITAKTDAKNIRFSGLLTGTATDVVINIKRNGAWLTA